MFQYLHDLGTDRLPVFGEAGEEWKMIRVEHRRIAHQGLAAEKIRKTPGQGASPNFDFFAPGFFETLVPGQGEVSVMLVMGRSYIPCFA